jgi:hypothetical protein
VNEAVGYKENVTLKCNLPNPQFYLKTLEVAVTPQQGETPTPTDKIEKLIEDKEGKYKVEGDSLLIEDLSKCFYLFFLLTRNFILINVF